MVQLNNHLLEFHPGMIKTKIMKILPVPGNLRADIPPIPWFEIKIGAIIVAADKIGRDANSGICEDDIFYHFLRILALELCRMTFIPAYPVREIPRMQDKPALSRYQPNGK